MSMENFAVFEKTEMEFSNLNVIVGENGTGKTHLLKMLYAMMSAIRQKNDGPVGNDDTPLKSEPRNMMTEKIIGTFRPGYERVGRLVSRRPGLNKCNIKIKLLKDDISIGFTTRHSDVDIMNLPAKPHDGSLVFIPPHELLSIYPNFVSLYDRYGLAFDETWYDMCKLLGLPIPRGRNTDAVNDLLRPLEEILGGSITFNGGRFYLLGKGANTEITLVAEGLRKVGMLAHLISVGAINKTGCLFWDGPESNLNPKIIRRVAEAICKISLSGTQVFVATHSTSLLKEFHILKCNTPNIRLRYFALSKNDDVVSINPADDISGIAPFVALDEELEQDDRFLEASQND